MCETGYGYVLNNVELFQKAQQNCPKTMISLAHMAGEELLIRSYGGRRVVVCHRWGIVASVWTQNV